jgi:hypothetical protein
MVGLEKCVHIKNSFTPVTAALNFKVKKKQLQVTSSCTTTTTFENGIYGLLGALLTHANINAAVLLTAMTVYGTVTSPTDSGNAQRLIKRASSLQQNFEMKEDQKDCSPT